MDESSMYLTNAKGLINLAGQNNCFLNVVIQALWHLRSFRTGFAKWDDHQHTTTDTCVHCALKLIFTQYQFSDESNIPPFALRDTLAALYRSEAKFQQGDLDDAAEALEAVLTCLQRLQSGPREESLSHRVFGIDLLEQLRCTKCGSNAPPTMSSHFIYYTYVSAICDLRRSHPTATFEQIVRTVGHQDHKSCVNEANCSEKVLVTKELHQHPEVFAMGLVWSTPDPTQQEIVNLLRTISTQIDLSRIFGPHVTRSRHLLRGMICYYGKHYDAYFYSRSRKSWMVFDDITVKSIGMQWEDVVDRCRRGRFHPSVLFYETDPRFTPAPTVITTTTATPAPTATTPVAPVTTTTPAPTATTPVAPVTTTPVAPVTTPAPVPTPVPTPAQPPKPQAVVEQQVPTSRAISPDARPVVSVPMPANPTMALPGIDKLMATVPTGPSVPTVATVPTVPVRMVPVVPQAHAGRVHHPVYQAYFVPVYPVVMMPAANYPGFQAAPRR